MSRFHQLPEFDQEKRSCRRRLAGHNERRRKPQPPSLLTSRYGRISSSLLGNATTAMSGSFLADPMAWPPARALAGSAMSRPLSSPTWRINHEPHPLNTFPQGSCSAAESCAHSFLSNQQHQPSHAWQVSTGFNLMTVDGVSVPQHGTASSHHQYPNPPWDLKGGENISGSSHNMPPVQGLGRISEATIPQTGSRAAMGGFELSQNPHTRRLYMEPENHGPFDSSPQNINWHL